LALLGICRLRLEVEAQAGSKAAIKILTWRRDFNFLRATVLWGNVSINVLLTLLSDSVMTGVAAFSFSTFLITLAGEIAPQAYFSRHAMRMGSLLAPVLRFCRLLLFPVAKPSAMVLDWWLGKEGIRYFHERDLRAVIHKHIEAEESDVSRLEGIGAMNFLALDGVAVTGEGADIDPDSILSIGMKNGAPRFPSFLRATRRRLLPAVCQPLMQKMGDLRGRAWTTPIGPDRQCLSACLHSHKWGSRPRYVLPSAYRY
jgi:hypothetical protein